jgi:hypothetical protein
MKPVSSFFPGQPFLALVSHQYKDGSAISDEITVAVIGAGGLLPQRYLLPITDALCDKRR